MGNIDVVETKSGAVFGPVDERVVTAPILKKTFEKFSCEQYEFKHVSDGKEMKKSDITQEIFDVLKSKNVVFPADTATMRFRDMDEKNGAFEAAQGLAALGVMPVDEGQFADGQIKSFELNRLMEQAFSSECGFIPNSDPDRDQIQGEDDLCPTIPGDKNGCPETVFRPRTETAGDDSRVKLRVSLSAETNGFLFQEKTDIQEGDLFRAVIRSPKTGENLSESAVLEVK